MAIIIRFLVIALILYLLYRLLRYVFDPKRKLETAIKSKSYYFCDDVRNARKNFFITLRGALFEGEKYLENQEVASEVVSIFVWAEDPNSLQDFTKEDFSFLEKEIQLNYPTAVVNWKNPIEQLMKN